MKFINTFITLLAATTALSYKLDESVLMKRQLKSTKELPSKSLPTKQAPGTAATGANSTAGTGNTKACQDALKKDYKQCYTIDKQLSKENIDGYCNTFNSEKCQKLFKEGMVAAVPECSSVGQDIQNKRKTTYDTIYYTFKLLCARDETNKLCPLSDIYLSSGNSGFAKDGFTKAVDETCKSKKCTDETIEAFNILNNSQILDKISTKTTTTGDLKSSKTIPGSTPDSKLGSMSPSNPGSTGSTASTGATKALPSASTKAKRDFIQSKDELTKVLEKLKSDTCTSKAQELKKAESADGKKDQSAAVSNVGFTSTLTVITSFILYTLLF